MMELAAVKFGNEATTTGEQFWYEYCYNTAGRAIQQRLQINTGLYPPGGSQPVSVNIEADYTWDSEGRLTGRSGPDAAYAYQFDSMGRTNGMSENGNSVATATYGTAGELLNLTYDGYTEIPTSSATPPTSP